MSRLTGAAIILRTRPYGESDLIVDLYTEQGGRTSVVARGALRSKRRYMGILELGQIVKIDYLIKPGLSSLGPCDLLQSVRRVRDHLQALEQLYYILELCLHCTPLDEKDEALFQSMVELISAIESEPGVEDTVLIAWELSLLTHLGYHLKIDRCPFTGLPPDGLSFEVGGSISSQAGRRYWPVKTDSLRALYRLQRGVSPHEAFGSEISHEELQEIRAAFVGLWGEITGKQMKTNRTFKLLFKPTLPRLSIPEFKDRLASESSTLHNMLTLCLFFSVLCFYSCQGFNERTPSTAMFEVQGTLEQKNDIAEERRAQEHSETQSTIAQNLAESELDFTVTVLAKESESLEQELGSHSVNLTCLFKGNQTINAVERSLMRAPLRLLSVQSQLWIETDLPQEWMKEGSLSENLDLPKYKPIDDDGGLWVLYTAQNGLMQSLILAKPAPWLSDRAYILAQCRDTEVITKLSFTELNTKRLLEPPRQLKLVPKSSQDHSGPR